MKVYTKEDLERLRYDIDLGEGTFGDRQLPQSGSGPLRLDQNPALDVSGKSEAHYRTRSAVLRSRLITEEEWYQKLSLYCEREKGVVIQGTISNWNMRDPNRPQDEKGNPLSQKEYTDQVCAKADRAKSELDKAQQDLDTFLEDARQKGIPPGWVGLNDWM